jgi:alpha-L-rhamnosidase
MLEKFGPSSDLTITYPNVAVSNAIVGNYLRLELLLRDKMYDAVLKECKEFFTKMSGTTGTLWEHSNQSASLNHGFASVVAEYIVKCLNGE